MPELPEVEVLVRHLRPLLQNQTIRRVTVRRPKVLLPTASQTFRRVLRGAQFKDLSRRGKYLVFTLRGKSRRPPVQLLGHLGMTGRMYLAPKNVPLPKHAAVVFALGRENFIYEDTRYFGRLTLDIGGVSKLGPEPLDTAFTAKMFASSLRRSRRAIKVKLLDQTVVAGIGNIYASEALFRARISPKRSAARLNNAQTVRLRRSIRLVLREAIACGSTLPLSFDGGRGELFYFGRSPGTPDYYEERLRVYDRAGMACRACATPIKRIVQAARSTFYCPKCQRG
jgi:formamidopyrimidine-DNA glycosylase